MTETAEYTPPKVWTWNKEFGGRFANINRPIAGATHEKELPVGRHPLQLYSLGTPNGVKVTIMLEELLAAGHKGAEYDAWLIDIGKGDQFGSGFVERQSEFENSRRCVDRSGPKPIRVFESGAILVLSRREVRRLPSHRRGATRGMHVVAVLADGQRAIPRRRLRAFLRLRADEDRIRDRPLRHGGEAPDGRARSPAGRDAATSPATTTRSPTWRSSPGTAGSRRAGLMAPANS